MAINLKKVNCTKIHATILLAHSLGYYRNLVFFQTAGGTYMARETAGRCWQSGDFTATGLAHKPVTITIDDKSCKIIDIQPDEAAPCDDVMRDAVKAYVREAVKAHEYPCFENDEYFERRVVVAAADELTDSLLARIDDVVNNCINKLA